VDWFRDHWQTFLQSPYFWDWITLACGAVAAAGFLWGLVLLLGLPGRIAVARNHPDAEAVYTMGWVGFVAIVPWIQALIWAFKPTNKVDIRYFPQAERISERESLEHLAAYAYGKKHRAPAPDAEIDAAIDRESGSALSAAAAPGTPPQTPPEARPPGEEPAPSVADLATHPDADAPAPSATGKSGPGAEQK
jgi:hypothetical protein